MAAREAATSLNSLREAIEWMECEVAGREHPNFDAVPLEAGLAVGAAALRRLR